MLGVPIIMIVLLFAVGCANTTRLAQAPVPPPAPAVEAPPPQTPVPAPPPLDLGTLMASEPPIRAANPKKVIRRANAMALRQPATAAFKNGLMRYVYEPHAIFRIDCAVSQATDLVFAPGEIVKVYNGLDKRWIIEKAGIGEGELRQDHLLILPTEPDLKGGLTVLTSLRPYYLDMRSHEDRALALVAVMWEFTTQSPATLQTVAAAPTYHVGYTIKPAGNPAPSWTPIAVWDNGRQTIIQFPESLSSDEAPVLYVVGKGKKPPLQLVNYRQKAQRYIVDRLAPRFQLRVGTDNENRVWIERDETYRTIQCPGDVECTRVVMR